VHFVANADEAHLNLSSGLYDIQLMSYDDVLSMVYLEGNDDICTFMPIHGGMLYLCGDYQMPRNTVGIDTMTGYARVLF
jgi:hypothetical protein